jgi:hypothetical protein
MKKHILFSVVLFLFTTTVISQVKVGGGINIGYKNTGIEFQGYALERIKLFTGLNLSRYDSYSSKIGCGLVVLNLKKKHNFWINSNLEYKFEKTTTLEKNNYFYSYRVNNLNFWTIGGAYSLRFNSSDNNSFLLLEVELCYRQLLNQLIIEDLSNVNVLAIDFESEINDYYNSKIGFSIGLKYVW